MVTTRYLSPAEYLLRYGAEEVVQMTAGVAGGRITAEQLAEYVDATAAGNPPQDAPAAVVRVYGLLRTAISDAEDFALSVVGPLYPAVYEASPLTAGPTLMRQTAAIARQYLAVRKMTPSIRDAGDAATMWLKAVARGTGTLGLTPGAVTTLSQSGGVGTLSPSQAIDRVFSSDGELDRFIGP